jgi:AcrR family transcriptional regulator
VASRQLLSRPDRQASILRAAATAFARAGYQATSMDDVAAHGGVTRLIVYRHFRSKEELYRAVLEQVSVRLASEFRLDLLERDRRGIGSRALLTVAREDPSGFVLLWRHAAREPEFAAYAAHQHGLAVLAAASLLAGSVDDGTGGRWVARAVVAWLVDAVLAWLDEGDPARDEDFLHLVSSGLAAMVHSWHAP